MPKSKLKYPESEVLCYRIDSESKPQSTVRSYYMKWRLQQEPPIPLRCDEEKCPYFSSPLIKISLSQL